MSELRYDGQVCVVTGAGAGLGRAYARFFAERGAKVVVNDLGGSFNAKTNDKSGAVADQVVAELRRNGGTAVANYDAVQQGNKIIKTAIDNYGRIDILVNNAGILRDVTLRNMTDADWDAITDVHLHGAYKTTRAAWPYFRKQRYGRIIQTTSASGLFGNFGQSNYAAAKFALVGFAETLAKEGAKYNINTNVLAPGAASRLTQTVWPKEMMDLMAPEWVVPIVGYLTHQNCHETGSIFEAGAGHFSKIRWERAQGLLLKPDDNLSGQHIIENWQKVVDFESGAEHPIQPADLMGTLKTAGSLPQNKSVSPQALGLKGKVALVTGAGAGLGRAYARALAKYGASVVVNDIQNAGLVADEIRQAGGEATHCDISVEQGDAVVGAVLQIYARIDIVVNNAGILRDKAFANMTDDTWNQVVNVHLRGTYKTTRAALPHMVKQKYGRIVNITSTSGIYGNFGQANYAAAKAGVLGFTKAIAREGQKYNVFVNVVAPTAGTNMTRTIWPEEAVQAMKPEYVAPLVAALCSAKPPANGGIFEAGGGWFSNTRWQRARGVDFDFKQGFPSVEAVAEAFPKIISFDQDADWPDTPQDGSKYTSGNALRAAGIDVGDDTRSNRRYISKIQSAIEAKSELSTYTYDDRDVILYNLGVGAKRTDLDLVFEGADNFSAVPTFGVVPTYFAKASWTFGDIVPNYDQRKLLHGEQYLEILQWPIPTGGVLNTDSKLIEVVDKGNAAVVKRGNTTFDSTGRPIFYNESALFIRGSGGFGGGKKPADRGAATAMNNPPSRQADKIVEEKTSEDLAAVYRLMGDRNPLHIEPEFAKVGGFDTPILHGLASFGITGKHVFQQYGPMKSFKVRFAGVVLPGQTIVTEMWKEGNKIIYRAKVKETGKPCISHAAAELRDEKSKL
ncbi:putative short-chain dehydrogenase/reductase SDR, maoC-like dehydratase domain-containing protein [Septoria linicola]|nr:putative short-chain dehydrogenase/reductase SDR, maoC-like dehydratase domain-containing protein [Septoria linicola]